MGSPLPGLPPFLEVARTLLKAVGRVELFLAVVALVVVVVLSGAQAFLRYSFGTSLWWAQEIAELTIIFSYFLGISYVYKTRQDILVDFLVKSFPMSLQMVIYILVQAATIAFTFWTVVLVVRFAPTAMNMSSPILKLPGLLSTLPIGIGSAMIVLTSLYYMVYAIWALLKGAVLSTLVATEAVALIMPQVTDAES